MSEKVGFLKFLSRITTEITKNTPDILRIRFDYLGLNINKNKILINKIINK